MEKRPGSARGRESEAGVAAFLAILVTAVGFFLVALVVTLWVTGLAEERIIPMIQQRIETAINGLPLIGKDEVPEPPPPAPGRAPSDSLQALVTQIETEKAFIETRERQLDYQRAEIDSVMAALATIQNDEVRRQAKLYAAMKPDEAARILYALDDATLVAILKNMNARAASKIMGRLDPRRLARLSMEGIGRAELAGVDMSEQAGAN
ncbi:MAG: hypothetical protein R3E97_09560 [Candidatus Eisenbacteria bacterium]